MLITIYTDGATKGNGTPNCVMGMGAVFLHLSNGNKILHQQEMSWTSREAPATNQRAELLAIKYAIEEGISRASLRGIMDLTIITDSQWAINAITGRWAISHHLELIQEIRQTLRKFRSHTLTWVRGHDGNEHNERADVLAFSAARKEE